MGNFKRCMNPSAEPTDYFLIETETYEKIVNDKRLSFEEVGLLIVILSLKKNPICIYELKKISKESYSVLNRIIKDLRSNGYLHGINITNHCVYIVTFDGIHHKIGKTKNIGERFKEYETHNPLSLKITKIISTNDIDKTEKFLLNKFNDRKYKSEWFKFEPQDLDYINDFKATPEFMEVKQNG